MYDVLLFLLGCVVILFCALLFTVYVRMLGLVAFMIKHQGHWEEQREE
jgi:hypothetical protein